MQLYRWWVCWEFWSAPKLLFRLEFLLQESLTSPLRSSNGLNQGHPDWVRQSPFTEVTMDWTHKIPSQQHRWVWGWMRGTVAPPNSHIRRWSQAPLLIVTLLVSFMFLLVCEKENVIYLEMFIECFNHSNGLFSSIGLKPCDTMYFLAFLSSSDPFLLRLASFSLQGPENVLLSFIFI